MRCIHRAHAEHTQRPQILVPSCPPSTHSCKFCSPRAHVQHMLRMVSCDIDVNAGQMCGMVLGGQPGVCMPMLSLCPLSANTQPAPLSHQERTPRCLYAYTQTLACAQHILTTHSIEPNHAEYRDTRDNRGPKVGDCICPAYALLI